MRVLVFINPGVTAWTIPAEQVDALRSRFPDIDFVHVHTEDEARAAIGDADIALSHFLTPAILAEATRLRWIQASTAGVGGAYPLDELARRGIVLTNLRGLHGVPIAEHVMAGVLALAHRLPRMFDAQREHRWIQNDLTSDYPIVLAGKRMTVLGLGAIGLEIAKRAHAFGIRVTGVRRQAHAATPDCVERILGADDLDDALTDCDLLIITAPGIAETRGLIGGRELDLLRRGALLVNVARAAIVDHDAMLDALRGGQLGGAMLDVFDQEPLDPGSPLWDAPNVIITPHSSGFRATHWDEVVELFSENIERFRGGQPLREVIDLTRGY